MIAHILSRAVASGRKPTLRSPSHKRATPKGASLVEYGLLVGGISSLAIMTLAAFAVQVETTYQDIEVSLDILPEPSDVSTPSLPSLPAGGGSHLPDGGDNETGDTPHEDEDNDGGAADIGPFVFYDTILNRWDSRARIVSNYVDIPGLEGEPVPFLVTSDRPANALAIGHVVEGQPAASGHVIWGTQLEVDPPAMGERVVVTLQVGSQTSQWVVSRESAPVVQTFGFPDTIIAWNDSRQRIESSYVDIPGLEDIPYSFDINTSDNAGSPRATSNVSNGTVRWGTQLEVDTPEPGETRLVGLTIDDVTGVWRVTRQPIPDGPAFTLSSNNGMNFAQIRFDNGIPQRTYPFSLSGTGVTAPRAQSVSSGSPTSGMTPSWGFNITNTTPARGQTETITLTIDGQILTWTVTGP